MLDLELLHFAAEITINSESGFVPVEDMMQILQAAEGDGSCTDQAHCPWLHGRKNRFVSKLLQHLPVMYLDFHEVCGGNLQKSQCFTSRPTGGPEMLHQIVSLVAMVDTAATNTQSKIESLPVQQYLQSMETERDRRVFKGIVAQITSDSFVRSAFNWRKGSIAAIKADLGMVDFYIADLNRLLTSVDYCATVSVSKRKAMRVKVRLALAQSGFLERKRGGRPSLLHAYS